ncbi:MAG TPA: DUF885 domain-containing protein [Gammaproteobacteria bacterium]|nr:DUF885 domain-containing protein [Gammaproteobacteria bacterium]
MYLHTVAAATLTAALGLAPIVTAAAAQDWVTKSDSYTALRLKVDADFNPEFAAQIGLDGYDALILDIRPGYQERYRKALEKVTAQYRQALRTETDPQVRQDLEILITSADEALATQALYEKHLIDYYDLPETIFRSTQSLINPQIDKARHPAALARLHKYLGMEKGYLSVFEHARRETAQDLKNPKLIGPYVRELQKSLDNMPRFVAGVRQLFAGSEVTGWEPAVAELEKQVNDYAAWLRTNLLPRARQTSQLPAEIYAANLRNFGVRMDPHELIGRATAGFMDIRLEMQALAKRIAKERGFKSDDYRDVIRALKKEQFTSENIMPAYHKRLADIEAIIRAHDIVTLPQRDAIIRLASEAESAAQPAPHMRPPRLIGNTGEQGEFVLPLKNPNAESAAQMDDFLNDAIAWTLTVHEARPGHEMQFAKMVENGVSRARMLYAFNSANAEGWALYAEAVMLPYLPPEGQLMSLQMRLLRAARAFLDPMVNLGMTDYETVRNFLMKEIVLSEPMATQEADRYTFRAPGQATSYYYGHMKMQEIRAKAELALGEKFRERDFHDFILAQGLLPPELMAKAVEEGFVKPRL